MDNNFIFKSKIFIKCQKCDIEVEEQSTLSGFSMNRLCVFDQDTKDPWGSIKRDNNYVSNICLSSGKKSAILYPDFYMLVNSRSFGIIYVINFKMHIICEHTG